MECDKRYIGSMEIQRVYVRKLGEACGDESEVKSLMRFQAVIRSIFRNILSSYNFEAKYFLIIKFHERSLRVL